jgi:hypothetical protein
MAANHLGPYSQEGVWQISGAHNSGEASAIFEVDLNGFVSGNMLAFTWSNEFRPLSWGTVTVAGASYQANHVAKTVSSVNGASIDTGESPPFGTGAGKFVAANSEYLSIPNSSDFNFGSKDFTIDFWVKFNSLPTSGNSMVFLSQYTTADSNNNAWWFYVTNFSGSYSLILGTQNDGSGAAQNESSTFALTTGRWYHIAVAVHYGNCYFFLNGTLISIGTTAMNFGTYSGSLYVSNWTWGTAYLDGWLDEVRISKGIARWTSNFTPPTAEYTPDQYTVLLLHMNGTNGSTMFTDSNSGPVNVEPASSFGNFYTYDGVYQVFLPSGNYEFTINEPGYAPQTWAYSVSSGQTGTGANVYLEQSQIPVPEFTVAVVAFAALAASLYLLKRRRK